MIIQEPIKATISFALENYAYADAIFLAERLYAEVKNTDNLFLLATAYFRSGKPNIAYSILSRNKYVPQKSPNCHFLRARCCLQLTKYAEAVTLLLEPLSPNVMFSSKKFSQEEITSIYGELSSFVAQLLGQLLYKLEDFKLANYYLTLSLKLNPFLWSSFEKLLRIDPIKVDHEKIFSIDSFDLTYSCGTHPLIKLLNSTQSLSDKVADNTKIDEKKSTDDSNYYFVTPEVPKNYSKKRIELSTPYAILKQSPGKNKVDVITPESDGNWLKVTCLAPTKNISRNVRSKFNTAVSSPSQQVLMETSNLCGNRNISANDDSSRHTFGVLSLDQDTFNILSMDNLVNKKSSNNKLETQSKLSSLARKTVQDSAMIIDDTTLSITQPPILTRRSSRLNSDVGSIKENSSNSSEKIIRRVTPVKRCRRTINFDKNKLNNENKSSSVTSLDINKTGVKAQRASANGLMELIEKFAKAFKFLAEYRCQEAIECLNQLPKNHYKTGLVLSMIGRCYFEMGSYEESIEYFKSCRRLEPYRLDGLEFYSTALWHLQRELELSCLSQELIQYDRFAPQTWCVAGNCFSLQKDHEISIKFLKRAIQVDPNFSYAYTLLGHELISADELDNAMSCFNNATRIDPRHYNAWCGVGLIFYKQEKYENAAYHYRRALEISPFNPILMCHLAIVSHHVNKSKEAIDLLNEASKLDPNNVLIKFHRASIHFSLEDYNLALTELEELKKLVPKESMIYFLIGKIHKKLGDTHLAVMNFSWAVHIDPKGSANQHKEFMEPNQTSTNELVVHPSQTDGSDFSSTPGTTPFTQRSSFMNHGTMDSSGSFSNHIRNTSNIRTLEESEEFNNLIDVEVDAEDEESNLESNSIEFRNLPNELSSSELFNASINSADFNANTSTNSSNNVNDFVM
ncbi:protein transport protein Sec61 subunit beta [Sarcoptes scabiei]|nr:protein transport protein Sec61 subunit beta [Sarcoptes scabiei]